MSPYERVFKTEYAFELARLAAEDLRSAQILMDGDSRPETTLFLVQQSVEKFIKAVLCARGLPVPLSQDLDAVLKKLPDDLPPVGARLADLTPFATIRRYEEGKALLSRDDVQSALEMANQVAAWAAVRVGATAP